MKKDPVDIKKEVQRCTFCGSCRAVCPVFKLKGKEIYSTRGRINLVNGLIEDEIKPDREVKKHLDICLNCLQCSDICPAGVETETIMTLARAQFYNRKNVFSLKKYFLRGLFSYKDKTSSFFFRMIRRSSKFLFSKGKLNPGGKFLFKIFKISPFAVINENPSKDFFNIGIRNKLKKQKYRGIRISLFLGCGGKYIYPRTADRFVRIIRDSGIQVIIPEKQVCCGSPLISNGLISESRKNRASNLSVFNSMIDIKYIVSLCSNASEVLKSYGHDITGKSGLRLAVKDPVELIIELDIPVHPFHLKNIVFHSCPKCSKNDKYRRFIEDLYFNSSHKPVFDTEFCGSTELYDQKNLDIRYEITRKFLDRDIFTNVRFIACSSFECMEYLNRFLNRTGADIEAIHFIDALKV